jgi:hypothetical protein
MFLGARLTWTRISRLINCGTTTWTVFIGMKLKEFFFLTNIRNIILFQKKIDVFFWTVFIGMKLKQSDAKNHRFASATYKHRFFTYKHRFLDGVYR